MQQLTSAEPQRLPWEFDSMFIVKPRDIAGKKEDIYYGLRSFIHSEYRKYTKAKKLKRFGPFFVHERCITFSFDHPNPAFGKVMTYRLHFGPNGVIVTPVSVPLDPEIAPFLEPVNLSQVKNEFFNPADFEPRKRRLIAVSAIRSIDIHQPAKNIQPVPVIALPEIRFITTCGMQTGDHPSIAFGGRYLERFGFKVGAPVTMLLEQNKITLTVAGKQGQQTAGRQSA